MPVSPRRRGILQRRPAIMLAVLLAAAVGYSVFRSDDGDSPLARIDPEARAVLMLDGVDYPFDLDTCFVGDNSFVVAGHGQQGDEDFRVLASPSEVELAFGVVDEGAPVPEDSRWFVTKDNVDWSATGTAVSARLNMIERLADTETPHQAELTIDCGTAS